MAAEKRPLGDILIQAGLLTPSQLHQALETQKSTGLRLGEILVSLGLLSETDVTRAVATQLSIPFLADHELQVDMTVARLVPPPVARRTRALPLKIDDGRLHLAMVDPLDVFSQDEIRHLVRRPVSPIACTPGAFQKALSQYEKLSALGRRDPEGREGGAPAEVLLVPDPEDAPIVQLVNEVIDRAIADRASDIHIEPGEARFRVRIRIDGFLRELMTESIHSHPAVAARLKVMASLDIAEKRAPQDGRIELRDKGRNVDLRVSTLPTVFGEKIVLRIFDRAKTLPKLTELGFGAEILKQYQMVAARPHGMLLVTGPTGSGKTSTLMSTLSYLNHIEKNIVTIEDPVEYQLAGINHVAVNPKAGLTFADGLRSILRQDPNIIMIGEIRDGETADIAVRAALTGHLVLSTLHTNDAAGALTRLVDMGVEPYLTASSVLGVLAQRLVRRLCPACREAVQVDAEGYRQYGCDHDGDLAVVHRPTGCAKCGGSGYSGRFPIFEFLRITPAVQELVISRASAAAIRAQAQQEGMRFLITSGLEAALRGETSQEEVFRVAAFSE
ncbi:MAG TPA: GspE/PulE family protein [Symbiobacteriaceae bacterium]|nr:GspE/PulE family protein [Symbiobacteriaceae bacterium]